MSSGQLVEFTNLRMKIYQAAADALAVANPEYVEAFQRRLKETNGDLQRVIDETRPLIKDSPEDWIKVLTALLDVQLVIEKVRRSLVYLETDLPQQPDDAGARVIYHFDHWIFQMHALLERVDRLIATVFRTLVRPRAIKGWEIEQKKLRKRVRGLNPGIAKIRDPLAHGLGGGVTGPQEEQLWEPFLAGRLFALNLGLLAYQGADSKRTTWHSSLAIATTMAFIEVDQISQELSHYIPQHP